MLKVSLMLPNQEPFFSWNTQSLPVLDKKMMLLVYDGHIENGYHIEDFILYPSDEYDGGHLIIRGNCGENLGQFMSRGVIYVEGDVGNFAGTGMDAGTIVIKGKIGARMGANMTRGSIIGLSYVEEILPTFVYEGKYTLNALKLIFNTLKRNHAIEIPSHIQKGEFIKFRGDRAEENGRGELFFLAKENEHLYKE